MADAIEVLEVRLEGVGHPPSRVGILTRDPGDIVRFVADDAYIDLVGARDLASGPEAVACLPATTS